MTVDRQALLSGVDLKELLAEIGRSRGLDSKGKQHPCPCVDHEQTGKTPPVAVADDPAGYEIWKCHGCEAGGTAVDALVLSGRAGDVSEAFEQLGSFRPKPPRVIERYPYADEQGELLFEKERMKPKSFRQRRPDGKGGWTYNLNGTRRVLYRLPKVLAAIKAGEWVIVVEGEADVHAVERAGKVATTMPGGAGKWLPEYTETLRGAKVAVVCDNDEVGRKHALTVATILDGIAAKLKLYEPPSGFKDVGEMLAAGRPLKDLRPFDDTAADGNGNGNGNGHGKMRLEVLTAKQMMALPDPNEEDRLLGPLIYKGHRIVIGGHSGHGKTSLTMHMVAAAAYGKPFLDWEGRGGLRALVIDVEQGTKTVKRIIRETGLEDSDRVHYLRVPDGLSLDTDTDEIATMEKFFRNGKYDIVLADPLYKLNRGDPNDSRAAVDLMRRFDDWRDRFDFALLMPMHCRKPHPNSQLSVHDLFGSASFQWGAEVLLGIERPVKGGKDFAMLHFWKDREGDLPPINTHWDLQFERGVGFRRTGQQRRITIDERVYAIVRDHGPLTRTEINERLGRQHAVTMGTLDRALSRLGGAYGITHNGEPLKKNRTYSLPLAMFSADDAVTNPGG